MHPDLLNNTQFLKYYKQWQDNPDSIVFASIAEYFLQYNLIDDAFKICREGLKHHPNLVSAHIVMAKIHSKRENWEEAEDELKKALTIYPENSTATRLLEQFTTAKNSEYTSIPNIQTQSSDEDPEETNEVRDVLPSWNTLTMANIFAKQGYLTQARTIYNRILSSDPENEQARQGLTKLEGSV